MTIPLRLMVTRAQRDLIDQAVRLEGGEFSDWARAILLEAAKRKIAKSEADKPARK